MDLNLTAEEESFRNELRAWLDDNIPAPWQGDKHEDSTEYWEQLRQWQNRLSTGGWAGVAWPNEFGGRGASPIQQSIFLTELARANAPQQVGVIGEALVGPTIIAVGTEDQKREFLPKMLSGEHIWCQGFSEPNAGSDVAALATKAIRDGGDFVVNGQKIWTSFAAIADWCLLLVRTDPEAPKHRGITCLLVEMNSPGITVKPLRQLSGDSGFNEVFFNDVRVPAAQQLGPLNQGWRVAITALMNERANLGAAVFAQFSKSLDLLIERSRSMKRNGRPLSEDPVCRQKIGRAVMEMEIYRLNANRALSRMQKDETPGPEGSILKLCWSEMNQRVVQLSMEILGDQSQLTDFDENLWTYNFLRSRGNTIEGGTSEVQRGILAERVLGLPKSY